MIHNRMPSVTSHLLNKMFVLMIKLLPLISKSGLSAVDSVFLQRREWERQVKTKLIHYMRSVNTKKRKNIPQTETNGLSVRLQVFSLPTSLVVNFLVLFFG